MEFSDANRGDERFVRQTERMRAELLDSGMPVYALTAADRPAPECFGGLELFDETITLVRVVYPPYRPDDRRVEVETARWGGTGVGSTPFAWLWSTTFVSTASDSPA